MQEKNNNTPTPFPAKTDDYRKRIIKLFKRFPETETINIADLDLKTRTYNALNKTKILLFKDLLKYAEKDLLRLQFFGKSSIKDLDIKIKTFIKNYKESSPNDYEGRSLRGLIDTLLNTLPDREKNILIARFGLWEGTSQTLEEIGEKYKLTRERIRQLESKAIKKLQQLQIAKQVKSYLSKITKRLFDNYLTINCGIFIVEDAIDFLFNSTKDEIITKDEIEIANVFLSKTYYDGELFFCEELIKTEENIYVYNQELRILFDLVVSLTHKYLKNVSRPIKLNMLIEKVFLPIINNNEKSIALLNKILIATNRILRDNENNLGLEEWPFFAPTTIKDLVVKALMEIGEPTHYTQITLYLNEKYPNTPPFTPRNIHVKLQVYKKLFVWVGAGIYGLKSWNIKKPPYIKDYLVTLLKQAKRPLNYEYLKNEALKATNCKEASVRMTLDLQDNCFIRYANNFYGLKNWE